jgi:Leucine-rich repeat (LRR) protein
VWCSYSSLAQLQCSITSDEYHSLYDLYNDCGGDFWRWDRNLPNNTIWTFPASLSEPCGDSWQRLQCAETTPGQCAVVSINLNSFGLSGRLPASIGRFSGLTGFNISTNSVMGGLPTSLSNLTSLITLALDNNAFTSTIPEELGSLTALSILFMNNNTFSGRLPESFGNITGLVHLKLSDNLIHGTIPSQYASMGALTVLELDYNRLEAPIVDDLFRGWQQLVELNLEANLFNMFYPSFYLVPGLRRVYLDTNLFTGSLPEYFCFSTSLMWLTMELNLFHSAIPTCIGNLTSLTDLNIFFNVFDGSLPSEVGLLTNMVNLKLGKNAFQYQIPSEIGNMRKLVNFNAYSNHFHGTVPSEFGNLIQLAQLQLPNNDFTGTLPSSLGNLTNLFVLELQINQLGGTFPTEIGRLTKMQLLYMGYNEFRGPLPTELGQLTNLLQLDVSVNSFTGTIPTEYGELNQLKVLQLANMPLTGTIPTELAQLRSIVTLYINENKLHGSLPDCLGNLTTLENFQFCCNNFTGTIPSSYGRLTSIETFQVDSTLIHGSLPESISSWKVLVELYAQNTLLSGTLPDSLTNLTKMGVLDLSNTYLTGTIPRQLGRLVKLAYLNLSFTSLEGPIPESIVLFRRLKILSLDNNLLTSILPVDLGLNQGLEYFSVGSNYLTGPVPDDIVISQTLQEFDTGENYLNGSVPFRTGMSKSLVYIVLTGNLFTGTLPSNWSEFKSLQYVYVDNNKLTGRIPDISLAATSKYAAVSLIQFCVADNQLTGNIPLALWTHTALQVLNLGNNNLVGPISSDLSNLHQLASLDLSTNRLSGDLSEAFNRPFPNMTFINLANNSFSKHLPSNLFQSRVLQVVTLNSNCFSGSLPSTICYSNELTSLIMDSMSSGAACAVALPRKLGKVIKGVFPEKKIEGSIPACVLQLPKLQSLQLSGNGLIGSISDVQLSRSLVNLQLSYNALTSSIPEALQHRGGFSFVSLQHNKLTGTLVSDFNTTCAGDSLALYLDVNRLSGNIPSSFLDVETISVLTGNLFECIGMASLPENDPSRRTYVCGSYQLNTALYVWMTAITVIGVMILGCYALLRVSLVSKSFNTNVNSSAPAIEHSTSHLALELRCSTSYKLQVMSNTPFDRSDSSVGMPTPQSSVSDLYATLNNRPKRGWCAGYFCWGGQGRELDDDQKRKIVSSWCCSSRGSVVYVASVINAKYENTLLWISFNYSSRRNLLSNTAMYSEVLQRAGEGALAIAGSYLVCMTTYIILKSGGYGPSYSTITLQYGWIITATFLHGLLPTLLILLFIVLTTFAIISSLKIDALQSNANKRSVQRELWKTTLRYSRSNAIFSRILDRMLRPVLVHMINLLVVLTANAVYVSVLLTIQPDAVFFFQASMSLFKIMWVNSYIPRAIRSMAYLPATAQFRHQVSMLLINYIIGPGIATAGANSNCFYPAIAGSPTVTSTFSVFNTVLECVNVFNFLFTQTGVDISHSTLKCSFATLTSFADSDTSPPFIYGYQCGSAFLVDYIPVLLYSYLFSATVLPIWRFIIIHVELSVLRQYLGGQLYGFLVAGSIIDHESCVAEVPLDKGESFSVEAGSGAVAGALSSWAATDGDPGLNPISNPLQLSEASLSARKTRSDRSLRTTFDTQTTSERSKFERPLFDGSLVVAKRILDFSVILTFGLACPLLALTIAFSVYINSLSWRLLIGKFLAKVGENNIIAFSRLEHSSEGLLRGAVGGMWIAVCAISLFWSVMFYDMVADQYGVLTGTMFALLTIFCVPFSLYVVFIIRGRLIERQQRMHKDRMASREQADRVRGHFSEGVDIWSVTKLNAPTVPTAEQNSVFI